MQSRYNTIEDLLKDESFISYCLRRNEQDIRYWEQYIIDHPDKKELIEEAIHEYRLLFTALANTDAAEQLQQLKQKIEGGEQAPVVTLKRATVRRNQWITRLKYGMAAAIAIVAVALYFLWQQQHPVRSADPAITYSCKQGERKSVQLPDGTQVVLNAGSEMILHEHYGQSTREVILKGEAFFEVQHNKQVPFIVHTSSMDVKALGTAFNVKSYSGEQRTEATLIRGLVEVTLKKDNNRKLLLHPDEKVMWMEPVSNEGTTSHRTTPARQPDKTLIKPVKKLDNGRVKELAWVENNLAFDDEPFEEIALQLSRWYNVTIQFESEAVKQYHFTGTFKKEKIEQVLSIFKSSKEFNYRVNGQTIVIY